MSQEVIKRIIRDNIIHIFESDPDIAFTAKEIKQKLPESNIDSRQLMSHLRQIISSGKIRVVYGNSDTDPMRYKLVPPKYQEQFIGLDDEAHKIYDMIEKSGNKGIWRRDLKKAGAAINDKRITAVLKELEGRCLVRSVTSIHEKKLKLYLLYDVLPSIEITGGVWWLDGSFNTDFVEQLIRTSIQIVHSSGGITVSDMVERIKNSSIVSSHISDKEAHQVIQAMVHTKRVIMIGSMLRPGILDLPLCPTAETPCCGCPVADICAPNGPINPRDCPYLEKLTELF